MTPEQDTKLKELTESTLDKIKTQYNSRAIIFIFPPKPQPGEEDIDYMVGTNIPQPLFRQALQQIFIDIILTGNAAAQSPISSNPAFSVHQPTNPTTPSQN